MDRLQGYRKMLRTGDWIKFYPLFPLTGAALAAGISTDLITAFALFCCVTAYGFVINNLYDVEIDRQHTGKNTHGKNPLTGSDVTIRGTKILCAVLAGIPLLASLAISAAGFVLTLLCLLALTAYSARPVRLKDRFAADILCHGFMFGGLPFLAGYALAGGQLLQPASIPLAYAALCTFIGCEALIIHEILDYHEDRETTYTTVVGIGLRNGIVLLIVTALLSIAVLEMVAWWFGIGTTFHALILAFLLVYPVYGCREMLMKEAERWYGWFTNDYGFRVR
jgi:4-hydroxybenzoate polyprenyltransferase